MTANRSEKPKPKIYWLAKATSICFWTSILVFTFCAANIFTETDLPDGFIVILIISAYIAIVVSLILGIITLVNIYRSNNTLTGKSYVILPIVLSLLISFMLVNIAVLFRIHQPIACGSNLSSLGKSMMLYAAHHKGQYPDPNNWCDLLIAHADADPKQFICSASGAEYGESSFALNINAVGRKLSDLPDDMVLIFEAKFDSNKSARDFPLTSRPFADFSQHKMENLHKNDKVYKDRWNIAGGPELVTSHNHNYKGCNIHFVNGAVSFEPADGFHNLRWYIDQDGPLPKDVFKFDKKKMWLTNFDPVFIIIGIIVVVTAIIGIGICFYKRQKTKHSRSSGTQPEGRD